MGNRTPQGVVPQQDFTPQMVYHSNIDQDVIVVGEDRLKLSLIENQQLITAKGQWIAPLGLILTFLTTFISTDFRDRILKASTWEAIYILLAIASLVWLIWAVRTAWNNRKKGSIESLVQQIKSRSKSDQTGGAN